MTGERILVVEDNEKNMKLFRDVLRSAGYPHARGDLRWQAIELAAEHAPISFDGHPTSGRRRYRSASPVACGRAHREHPRARA